MAVKMTKGKAKAKPVEEQVAELQAEVDASTQTFEVVFMSPTALKPYYRNSKKHTKRQVTLLAKAMRIAGFDQPIVVDKNHVIIKGHGRTLAALELKLDLVPVVVRADLTEEQVMASRIADNHVHTMSDVDAGKEMGEVKQYIEAGGSDAPTFFDFMSPDVPVLEMPGTTNPTPKAAPSVAGTLLTCPKCSNTFMEAKK
jgi:hypothetical protein